MKPGAKRDCGRKMCRLAPEDEHHVVDNLLGKLWLTQGTVQRAAQDGRIARVEDSKRLLIPLEKAPDQSPVVTGTVAPDGGACGRHRAQCGVRRVVQDLGVWHGCGSYVYRVAACRPPLCDAQNVTLRATPGLDNPITIP